MNHTFRTVCLALIVGLLAGTAATSCLLTARTHGKIGFEFDHDNGRQHLAAGHLDIGDATGRPPRFWGLQLGNGDSLTTIGIYSDRPARIAPALTAKSSPHLPE